MTADDVRARLLPCPFCGPGESVVDAVFDDVTQRWRVYCGRCGCSTGIHPRDRTQAPAIAAWNRRAAHADLSGEVRELVEALKAAQWDCHGKCPVCAGFMVGPNGETRRAHTASCPVGSALAKHQEKP
jgi:Lar family restriction alleviation protein